MEQLRPALLQVLDDALGPFATTRLLIEPTAGGGGALASDLDSLGRYLDVLGRDERIGVCLDTCHLHAAGHDLSGPTRMAAVLRRARKTAGPGGIGLLHVNDSRDPVGQQARPARRRRNGDDRPRRVRGVVHASRRCAGYR